MTSLSGVGLYFKQDVAERFFVDMILPQTSAEENGNIRKGDLLTHINGSCTLEDLRALVLGRTGTEANFSFEREEPHSGAVSVYHVTLQRGRAKPLAPSNLAPSNFAPSNPNPFVQPSNYATQGGYPGDIARDKQLRDAEVEKARLQGALEALQAERKDQAGILERAQEQLGTLRAEAASNDAKAKEAAEKAERLKAQLEGVVRVGEGQLEELRREADSLRQDGDERVRQAVESQKQETERERERAEQYREELEKLRQEMETEMRISSESAKRHAESISESALNEKEEYKKMLLEEQGRVTQLTDELDRVNTESAKAEEDSRKAYQEHVASLQHEISNLQQELSHLQSQKDEADDIVQSRVSRLCVIALPHAVAKLHEFIYRDTGAKGVSPQQEHPSTWAQLYAQEYVARMASTTYPLSIPAMMSVLDDERTANSQEAVFAMSLVSCDENGRNALLQDPRCCRLLAGLLQSTDTVCVRFAALCLANLSLEEEGREVITDVGGCMEALVDDVRYSDADVQRFCLQTLGNLCFLPRSRDALMSVQGSLEVLCNALESKNSNVVRYSAGCIRTLVGDPYTRERLKEIEGIKRVLLSLTSHKNAKVREHSTSALARMYGDQHPSPSSTYPQNTGPNPSYTVMRTSPQAASVPHGGGGSGTQYNNQPAWNSQGGGGSKGAIAQQIMNRGTSVQGAAGGRLGDYDERDYGGRDDRSGEDSGFFTGGRGGGYGDESDYVKQGRDGETEIHF